MDIEERLELVKQVGEEILTEEDLRKLLSEKRKLQQQRRHLSRKPK